MCGQPDTYGRSAMDVWAGSRSLPVSLLREDEQAECKQRKRPDFLTRSLDADTGAIFVSLPP
jgi:hypothetical protein